MVFISSARCITSFKDGIEVIPPIVSVEIDAVKDANLMTVSRG